MCTNLMISVPEDPEFTTKMHVSARAMELPGAVSWSLYAVPAGHDFPLPSTVDIPPSKWTTKPPWKSTIDFVGIAASGAAWDEVPTFNDGLNEHGLSFAALWMAPGTEYPPLAASGDCVSFMDFGALVLGTCSTVAQVEKKLQTTTIVGPPPPPPPAPDSPKPDSPKRDDPSLYYAPLHFIVTDRDGASLVIEFLGGETQTHHCANGVLTNWPSYDFQTANVKNYSNLTPFGTKTSVSGEGAPGGAGLQGLPGGPLSASRFVKATITCASFGELPANGEGWLPAPGVLPWNSEFEPKPYAKSQQTAVTSALQLAQICMGTPYGMLLETAKKPDAHPVVEVTTPGDYTMWSVARDHTHATYYVMPAFSGILTEFDLTAMDFGDPSPNKKDFLRYPVRPSETWCQNGAALLAPATVPVPSA